MMLTLKQMMKETRWLWLVVAATMFTGSGFRYFFRGGGGQAIVARINGRVVTQKSFLNQMKREEDYRRRLSQFGIKMGPLSSEGVLKSCLREGLLLSLAEVLQIEVGEDQVAQKLKKVLPKDIFGKDGIIDENMYREVLAQSGERSVEEFEREQKNGMILDLTNKILQKSYFGEAEKKDAADKEKAGAATRDFSFLLLNAQEIKENLQEQKVAPNEEELNRLYEENKKRFKDEGYAKLKGISIDVAAVANGLVVTDKEIAAYYDRHKQSKYTIQKNYTVDFWIFDGAKKVEGKDEEITEEMTEAKIQDFVAECKKENILDNFDLCEEKAKEAGLWLLITRNHKVVLGEGKFDKRLETAIVGIKDRGDFAELLNLESKVYALRLVAKEGLVVKTMDDARLEILGIIKKKKGEYEVARIASGISQVLKEAKGNAITADILAAFSEYEKAYPGCLRYEEVKLGSEGQGLLGLKLPEVDNLEVGRIGKIADTAREFVYVVEELVKRKPKGFEEVREALEEEWLTQKVEKILAEKAAWVKRELLATGKWPAEEAEAVVTKKEIAREMTEKEQVLPEAVIKVVYETLSSPKQVYHNVTKDGAVVIKLNNEVEDLAQEDNESNIYAQELLEDKLKAAIIEEYLTDGVVKSRRGGS